MFPTRGHAQRPTVFSALRLARDQPRRRLCGKGVLARQAGDRDLDHLGLADAVARENLREGGRAAEVQRVDH